MPDDKLNHLASRVLDAEEEARYLVTCLWAMEHPEKEAKARARAKAALEQLERILNDVKVGWAQLHVIVKQ